MAEKPASSPFPWLPFLAILLGGTSLFWIVPGLVSSRPTLPASSSSSPMEDSVPGEVSARLWQDPFGFTPTKPIDPNLHFQLRDIISNYPSEEVLILPVMVPSKAYVEDVEARLRARYAVLQALALDRLYPEDTSTLRYFCLPRRTIPDIEKHIGSPLIRWPQLSPWPVPSTSDLVVYEWFTREFDALRRPHRVLVLWLREDDYLDRPWTRLAYLFSCLSSPPALLPPICLLSPPTSGLLRTMIEEAAKDLVPLSAKRWLHRTTVLSSSAAAAENLLVAGFQKAGARSAQDVLEGKLRLGRFGPGFTFHRTNTTDLEIAKTLLEELRLRGIDPIHGNEQIAIISEIDTYYARALRTTFVDDAPFAIIPYLEQLGGWKSSKAVFGYSPHRWRNVHAFSYLRGLDGRLPSDKTNSPKKESGLPTASRRSAEPPDGLAQFDYLRNISRRLGQLDEQFRATGGVRAVGVLGSDIYDKLEILSALRPLLPNAVFFTNQLDARYHHPDEWEKTRNLIVAANAPLQASSKGAPSFRDSTQAALYDAVTSALEPPPFAPPVPPTPTLFEIGRHGPIEITPTQKALPAPTSALAPDQQKHLPTAMALAWVAALFASLALCIARDVLLSEWHALDLGTRIRQGLTLSPSLVVPPALCLLAMVLVPISLFLFLKYLCPLSPITLAAIVPATFLLLCWWLAWNHRITACKSSLPVTSIPPAPPNVPTEERNVAESPPFARNLLVALFSSTWLATPLLAALAVGGTWLGMQEGIPKESLSLVDGMSHWPSFALLTFSSLLALHFVFATQTRLKNNEITIAESFALQRLTVETSLGPWITPPSPPAGVCIRRLWSEYLARGRLDRRLIRAAIATLLYLVSMVFIGLIVSSQPPLAPFLRGEHGMEWLLAVRFFAVTTGTFLVFFILDAILLHAGFLRILERTDSHWPEATFRKFDYVSLGNPRPYPNEANIADYWDLLVVGRRTEEINSTIYYPFICLVVFGTAFLHYFDLVALPGPLLFVLTINCVIASVAAASLPAAARRYRADVLVRMRERYRREQMQAGEVRAASESFMKDVQDLHEGAFASLWEQPWLRAWLVPSGGVGLWTLLQYFPK